MSCLLSDHNLLRLRANSHTTLRFQKSLQQATELLAEPAFAPTLQLCRLLMCSAPLAPPPTLYLSHYPPAQNAFCSLLALLAAQPLSQPLHDLLTHAAVHPHAAQLHTAASLSAKDAVALNFVRAVVACPPRIPVQLRNALHAMYAPDKLHHIALIASFGAFYATLASLLGLSDDATSAETRRLDAEMRHLLSSAHADLAGALEPSEMSLPTSTTTHSRVSSAFSFSNRFSRASSTHFFQRVAHPLRIKLARHAVQHAQRTSWLAAIPSTRRAQNDLLSATMGFVPEYLTAMRSLSPRSVFIYLIHSILLSHSATLSPAIKNLACYILARSSENSVLTAHAAFLANRFGALDSQLSTCMDVAKLRAMQRAYARCDHSTTTSPTSSIVTPSDQHPHPPHPPHQPQLEPETPRRSRRADRFRFPEFSSGVAFQAASHPSCGQAAHSYCHEDGHGSDHEHLLVDDDSYVQSGSSLLKRGLARLTRKDSDRRNTLKRTLRRPPPRYEEFEPHLSAWDTDSCASSTQTSSASDDAARNESFHSLFALSDNPQVPDVSGLNSFADHGFDEDDVQVQCAESFSAFARDARPEHNAERDADVDASLFSRKEVAFLLLAHEVVQSSLMNSKLCSKYADAAPGPLISPAQAAVLHKLLQPEDIMEQIAVIATFGFLQRWLECYPYKPGALEAPVRRFAQSPIALSINLGSVGQRCNSRYAEDLREQTGRSLRLPRHAVAPRCEG